MAAAGGVYFANRTHRVRINVKKLRYAAEVARITGFWRPAHLVKDLKRIQGVLGAARDMQMLLDELRTLEREDGDSGVLYLLEDEIRAEHLAYLSRRERLARICAVTQRQSRPRRWWLRPAAA